MKEFLKRPSVWGTILSIAVIAITAFAYFYPDAQQGRTLLQHDIQQGAAIGQEITQYQQLTGEKSFWTNSIFSGMPAFQISPSYPSSSLFRWINAVYGLGLPAPSHLLAMMMIGMFILLMSMKFKWHLSLIGAIAWGFSSYFVIIIGAGPLWKFVTLAYVPPTIAGLVLIYHGRRWLGAGTAALFMMMQIASNHVQMTYYFSWVMAGFVIAYGIEAFRARRMRRWAVSTAVAAAAMALAIGANLPNLYNTYEYSRHTMRGQHSELTPVAETSDPSDRTDGLDRSYITSYSYETGETFSLLIPNINGGASARPLKGGMSPLTVADTDRGRELMRADRTGQMQLLPLFSQYFGGPEGTNGPVYVGAIILALAILGAAIVRGPLKWALVILTLLSVCLALGRNMMWLTDLFIDYIPLYSKFRAVESILVIAEFTLPLLAMLGLRQFLTADNPWQTYRKPLLWSFGSCTALCAVAILWPALFGTTVMGDGDAIMIARYINAGALPAEFDINHYPEVVNAAESIRTSMVASDALRSILFIGVALIALVGAATGKCSRPVALAVIAVAVTADLYTADKRYLSSDAFTSAKATTDAFIPSAADKIILTDTDPHFRVLNAPEFYSAAPAYFHKSIGGYHAAKLTRYQDMIERHLAYMARPEVGQMLKIRADSAMNATFAAESPENHRRIMADLNVLDMLNTKYVITDPAQPPIINRNALGNAWLISSIAYVDTPDDEMLALDSISPATTAVADRAFRPILGDAVAAPAPGDGIRLTDYAPNRLTYKARTAEGAIAVFSEIYFPWGWTATIDGEETSIARVDYLLRALRLPPGEHEVVMTFDPRSVHVTDAAAKASVAAIYLILILGIAFTVTSRKPQS